MSYNTIVRSFNHEDLYKAAQMHNLHTIYTLKYIVYTIITFFTCQNIIKMRELRRQEEIYQVTKDILENLPKNYNNLDKNEYTLHTNIDKNYQIKCIDKKLYLYNTNKKLTQSLMIADLTDEKNFQSIQDKLKIVEYQKKYDVLSTIKINNTPIIDNLQHLRIYNYHIHNKITDLIKYFNDIYMNKRNYKESPWLEKNISLFEYAKKFKTKIDYFIKNRYSKTYNIHNNPITADDLYELTGYFLYYNPKIKDALTNIKFGDPIIIDGIMNLINLDEGIKISNIQMLHTHLIEHNND